MSAEKDGLTGALCRGGGERGQKRELAKATLIFLPLPVQVRRR